MLILALSNSVAILDGRKRLPSMRLKSLEAVFLDGRKPLLSRSRRSII
ncbi:MAG: hypothetical protein QNJ32_23530 [Xenococcaceae cyanobacterium MO_167.B27]|nr:hypothetical protein [Xenococcaceae cyanobacterium MO_167.B27]